MDLSAVLTTYGPLGIGCLVCGYAFWKEREARTNDQALYSKTLLSMLEQSLTVTAANTSSNRDLEKAIYAQIAAYKEDRKL